ncbi:hypothetical protein [Sinorhizobium meliloti]|uniref:hypothetical protein n=1 Tax=Rhizobium meliloti TaxID=382 RepID=UPI0016498C3D|nr:hypothetical protein [Sinorhizobium meliloti]
MKTVIVQCSPASTRLRTRRCDQEGIRRTITQSVEGYQPTKKVGSNPAAKWKVLLEDPQDLQIFLAISHSGSPARSNARQRTGQGAAASLLEHAGNEGGDSYTPRFMFMDTEWGSYCDMTQTKSTDPLPFVPARPKPSRG